MASSLTGEHGAGIRATERRGNALTPRQASRPSQHSLLLSVGNLAIPRSAMSAMIPWRLERWRTEPISFDADEPSVACAPEPARNGLAG